ncbi:addiction module protein [Aliarcobacter cryaerophilus]|mgnify:FL=1|uniref:Addiction module protein n=1 Tax=Aliarcobacter cryaerophilus TaxID=28198 RepID=A0A2S9SQR3_9BACT|nr:addiction module protein [Aliarcobacter cryaerophilus]PRM88921.1 addiction module protein [Aliarcobacter cryaerophilus]
MGTNEIINEAIKLKPQEKYLIIESLILSLNEPSKDIEKLWIEESKKRLEDYKNGNLEILSFEEVFN